MAICVKIISRLSDCVFLYHNIDHINFYGDAFDLLDSDGNLLHCFSVRYFGILSVHVECSREAGAQLVEVRDPGAPEVAGESTALFF